MRLDILKKLEKDPNVFTTKEQSMMLDTRIYTDDAKLKEGGKTEFTYYTEDKLYAAYGTPDDTSCITVGKNRADSLSDGLKVSVTSGVYGVRTPGHFWLRTPHYFPDAYRNCYVRIVHSDFYHYGNSVHFDETTVVPAFRLNLSSVLFASAATAATSGASLTNTMTFRVKGDNKITSKVYYSINNVRVDAAEDETVYLYVQGNDGTKDWVYSKEISEDNTITASEIIKNTGSPTSIDLNQCKIWIEKKITDDNLVYAVMATEELASGAAYTEGGVTVNYDKDDGKVFLYVQNADNEYSVEITKDITVALSDMTEAGIESLTDENTKIWLKKSENNEVYTEMAGKASVTYVEKKVDCEADGNNEYWYFKIGQDTYYFSDEVCSAPIESVPVIPKTGHNWSYSLSGETTIEATCENACQKSPVTFTLTAPGNAVYDGSTGHKATVIASPKGVLEVPDITYNTGIINAGEVTAGITLGEGTNAATAEVTYEIEKATPDIGTVSAEELTDTTNVEDAELSYTNTAVSGTLALTDSELKYGTNTYNWKFTPTGEDAGNYQETTGTVEVTVKDAMAPTIQYQIGTNGWKAFTNKTTFGLFSDDYKTITIKYEDNDEVAAKQYYILNNKITNTSSIRWNDYTGPVSIDEKGIYVICAQATDNSNATKVFWDGYVLYEESTLDSESVDYTYKENKDCSVQVALNGNTFAKLTSVDGADENEIAAENYTMDKAGKLTLKASYLDTLKKGDYTYKIYMNPQGVETREVTLAYTFTVNVYERELIVTEATAKSRDYDGSADVEITGITLDNVAAGDDVSVKLDGVQGTLKGADAGDYTSVTLSELSLQGEDAGSYTLVQPADAVNTNVTIHKLDPAITVGTDSYVKTYGDAAFTLDVTDANEEAGVQYAVTDANEEASVQYAVTEGNDVVSVSNGTVTILKAGNAAITVSLPESTKYNAAERIITVTVNKAGNAPNMPENTISVPYSNTTAGEVTLPDGWAWQEADKDIALEVGVPKKVTAVYIGTDKGNYENETVEIAITRSDCEHTNTEVRDAVEATCGAEGYTGDTYCKTCEEKIASGKVIEKKAHMYGEPVFSWSENGKTCTVTFICEKDATHIETQDATVTSEVKTAATCKNKGTTTYKATYTDKDKTYSATKDLVDIPVDAANHTGEREVRDAVEATCGAEGYTGDTYCKACGTKTADGAKIDKLTTHTWDAGVVTKEATATEKGEKTYTCSVCKTTKVEEIPVIATKPVDNTEFTGYDTAEKTEKTEKTITTANTDKGDVKGSTFAALQLKAVGNNNSVKLIWKKVKDADGYILYAAQCGQKLKKLKTITGASKVEYTHKKLKNAKYYKYMVVAYKNINGKQYTIATSNSVHAVTNGGIYANPTKVTVKESKLSIKEGEKKTIKASYKLPKNKKVKVHIAKFCYESDNTKVATVTNEGVVQGKKKGTANIYIYAQNGVYKKVKVTVK